MKKAILLTPLFGLLPMSLVPAQAASIKAVVQARPIVQKAMSPEAITLSEDGQHMTFIARSLNEFSEAPPTSAWITHKTETGWSEPERLPLKGMVTSIAFAHHDQWIVITSSRGTAQGYMQILKDLFVDKEKIGNLEGFDHRIEIVDAKNPKRVLQSLNSTDLGLAKPEMLKHARISPDGKWLAYYTHGQEDQRGVHVYNFQTKKTTHMGLFDDKHPTWTPDGTKILFHNQSGGDSFTNTGSGEKSIVGYYDLKIEGNEFKSQRVLMDSETQEYSYQKHPSVYPGTDLLFFHTSEAPDKAKKLYVRRLKPNSKIYKLSDLMIGDTRIKSAKHANSSLQPTGIYFVGKQRGAVEMELRNKTPNTETEMMVTVQDLKDIYWISNEDVQEINRRVHE